MTPGELRQMARRLEAMLLLLETGDQHHRDLAEELRDEVAQLRRWASGGPPSTRLRLDPKG